MSAQVIKSTQVIKLEPLHIVMEKSKNKKSSNNKNKINDKSIKIAKESDNTTCCTFSRISCDCEAIDEKENKDDMNISSNDCYPSFCKVGESEFEDMVNSHDDFAYKLHLKTQK